MTVLPPYLQRGDTIGLVAPAGFMPFDNMQTCIDALVSWGYTVKLGATTKSCSENYFSGTDEERAADLQQMLDDADVKAILCARGGYGVSRIVDGLSFKKFKKRPKWIIGFSDITVLHAHLYARYGIATLHAPMAGAFNDGEFSNPYVQSLKKALEGAPLRYECAVHPFNRRGKAKGDLVGGNLALLAHLIGTPSGLATKKCILFLEDVGEYLYNIDRMLLQLKRSGMLARLSGLVIGHFSSCKDTTRPFGKPADELIRDAVAGYDYPVCFGFPVGHEKENFALKVGMEYRLEVSEEQVILQEKE